MKQSCQRSLSGQVKFLFDSRKELNLYKHKMQEMPQAWSASKIHLKYLFWTFWDIFPCSGHVRIFALANSSAGQK